MAKAPEVNTPPTTEPDGPADQALPLAQAIAERLMLATAVDGATLTPEQGMHLAQEALAGITDAGYELIPAVVDPDAVPVPPRDVADVAEAILARTGTISSMKLQKLAFYAQAYCLAWTGQPMFTSTIHAWTHGPVIPDLLDAHQGKFEINPGDLGGDPEKVTDTDRQIIDSVTAPFEGLTGWDLSRRTRMEDPWMDAFDENEERHHREITHEAMAAFYATH